MPQRDFYEVLGLAKTASPEEIKRAYRSLAKKYHPDRNPNDPSAERSFKEVQEAYSVLGNTEKRAQYDQFGRVGVGEWTTEPTGERMYTWGGGTRISMEDLEDLFSMFGTAGGGGGERSSGFFDQFFGASPGGAGTRTRRRPAAQPARGADRETPVEVSFEQAVRGATVAVRLKRTGGRTETVDVRIPPGVEDGQRIRLRGQGQAGRDGGPPGNLILVISVRPHPYFTRRGADIYLDVPISVSEAALGAHVEVPSLDGRSTVTIPPGTSSGTKLRLRGRGGPKPASAGHGDQYIVIQIVPPTATSEPVRRLLEELRQVESVSPRAHCPWEKG
ncbi:MAG TPA: J domain-containing protein [Phycisphaerae bacterium]|nr:J domain-containing protein [Phycisphaerae bacterium]HNU46873.1 J domain-containing protein [Phycisphaerae bacterium]